MKKLKPKVSIVGAGNVGVRYAYALLIRGLAREVLLVDIDKERAEGEVMDLAHGAPYINPVKISAGGYEDTKDSDLVVITAGKNQDPGETRLDLMRKNVDLMRMIIPDLMEYTPNAIFLVVSNPVDILSYAAYKISGKPSQEVIGSGTVLDSARFRYLIGDHCNIDPHNVHAYILGEHGDSEFPVWSKAMLGGVLLKKYKDICPNRETCDHNKELNKIFERVKNSAYKIIERKGETSYGIGLAMVRITRAILNDENAVLPVSSLVEDYLGYSDLYLSLPSVLNDHGIRETMYLNLNEQEKDWFKHSANIMRSNIEKLNL